MIQILVECDPKLESPKDNIVKEITNYALKNNDILNAGISIVFAQDNLLNELKKKYFYKDEFTDVIAFRLNEYSNNYVDGEIYISLPRAKINAKRYKDPYNKEIARLIIHGTLHLLGFEDKSKAKKVEMTKMEELYLNQVNWEGLL